MGDGASSVKRTRRVDFVLPERETKDSTDSFFGEAEIMLKIIRNEPELPF